MSDELVIRNDNEYLAVCSEIRALVARIETVEEAKGLADRASAAQRWAERARLGAQQINLATVAKLWAERRAGELLAQMKSNGELREGRPKRSRGRTVLPETVSKNQSADWQRLAAIPTNDFERAVQELSQRGKLSAAAVVRTATGEYSYTASPAEALHDTKREIRAVWDKATIFSQYDVRTNLRKLPPPEREELVERLLEAKNALDVVVAQALSIRNERAALRVASRKENHGR